MIIIVVPGCFPILANNRAFSPRLIDPQATKREDHRSLPELTERSLRRCNVETRSSEGCNKSNVKIVERDPVERSSGKRERL